VATITANALAPIFPKISKPLKLLDIRPSELARQLTIIESQMYQDIKMTDLFLRLQMADVEHEDSIAAITQFSKRVSSHIWTF
jgi:son of sevenless-like protein